MTMFYNPFKKKPITSAQMVSKKKIECLILLGDSILDNFYYIEEPENDIENQIISTLKAASNIDYKDNDNNNIIKIYNFALDGTGIDSILCGISPNSAYIEARKTFKTSSYPLLINDKDKKFYHMEILSTLCKNKTIQLSSKNNKKKNYIKPTVILSIGGADLRRNLKYGTTELIIQALRNEKFAEKYEKIVQQIVVDLGLNLIITICNEPHESFTEDQLHFSREDLLECLVVMACVVMKIGEKYKCPMIDLLRTFNTFDGEDYGRKAVNPSVKSGQYIVDILMEILATWDWNNDDKKSMIYYGIGQHLQQTLNTKTHRKKYFTILQNRASMLNHETQNTQEMDLLADLFNDAATESKTDEHGSPKSPKSSKSSKSPKSPKSPKLLSFLQHKQ